MTFSFTVLAQSFTSTHRITKTVSAVPEQAVLRMASAELETTGFYVTSIKQIG